MTKGRTWAVCAAAALTAIAAAAAASTVIADEPRYRAGDVERALLSPPDVATDATASCEVSGKGDQRFRCRLAGFEQEPVSVTVRIADDGGWGTESFPAGVAEPGGFTPARAIMGLGLRRR